VTTAIFAEAESELEEAFDYYEAKRAGLGSQFVHEFRRGIDCIIEHPASWAKLDDRYRRHRIHRFPFGIVYRLSPAGDQIVGIAVMHLSQKPGFWRKRDRN